MRVAIAQEWKNQLFVNAQKVLSTLSTVMTHFFNIHTNSFGSKGFSTELRMRVTITQEWKNQLFVGVQKVFLTLSTVMTHFFNICNRF